MGLISRVSSRTYRFDKMTEASITTTTSQKFKNLSESINSEFNKNKQTALYLQAKQDVMNIIQNVAKLTKTGKDYPNISLWLQGSSVNGFATKGSDADIVLMTGDHKDHPKEVAVFPAAFDEDKELKGSWAVEKSSEIESEDLDIEEDEMRNEDNKGSRRKTGAQKRKERKEAAKVVDEVVKMSESMKSLEIEPLEDKPSTATTKTLPESVNSDESLKSDEFLKSEINSEIKPEIKPETKSKKLEKNQSKSSISKNKRKPPFINNVKFLHEIRRLLI